MQFCLENEKNKCILIFGIKRLLLVENLFASIPAGVIPFDGCKKSPHIMQYAHILMVVKMTIFSSNFLIIFFSINFCTKHRMGVR